MWVAYTYDWRGFVVPKKKTSVGPLSIQSFLIQRVSQTKPVDTNFSRYRSTSPLFHQILILDTLPNMV